MFLRLLVSLYIWYNKYNIIAHLKECACYFINTVNDAKSWLIWKDPDAGKDWGQEENGMTEDKMVGWHHQLNGHEFGWTPGAGDGQGGLACCSSWSRKESDMTEWLNWTELNVSHYFITFSLSCLSILPWLQWS